MMTQSRIIGMLAQPDAMPRMLMKLESQIEDIKEAADGKYRKLLNAAKAHRAEHFRLQNRYCCCGICRTLSEMGE